VGSEVVWLSIALKAAGLAPAWPRLSAVARSEVPAALPAAARFEARR
jgi:hypothetical protein